MPIYRNAERYMARESLGTPVLNQNLVLPQASRLKSPDSQKNSLDLKKITRFKIFALKFAVLPEIMYLFTLFPNTSFASLQKSIILKPGKSHTNNKIFKRFSRAENDTTRKYLEQST